MTRYVHVLFFSSLLLFSFSELLAGDPDVIELHAAADKSLPAPDPDKAERLAVDSLLAVHAEQAFLAAATERALFQDAAGIEPAGIADLLEGDPGVAFAGLIESERLLSAASDARVETIGGTADQPTGQARLPVNMGQACPGFYVLRTHSNPAGTQSGRYGAEVLLRGSGLRTMQGGLNFGGYATSTVSGFSAFSIANSANEMQSLSIGISVSGAGTLILERRSSSQGDQVLRSLNLPGAGDYSTSINVGPGFYVLSYRPNSGTRSYAISALTSYLNRPGGGFQGGAVVGGWHNPSQNTSGFAGFCISREFDASVQVLSRPTYGTSGARGMAFSLASTTHTALDSRQGQTDDHGNTCSAATDLGSMSPTPAGTQRDRSGRIDFGGDLDYFRFQLNSAATVEVFTTGSTDTYGTLLNANCSPIAQDDDSGQALNFRIERNLSPGVYYVEVRHWSSSGVGPYQLSVRARGAQSGGGTDDHGNSCAAATSAGTFGNYGSGQVQANTINGRIDYANDRDFFRFDLISPSSVELFTTGSTDTYGTLFNANCSAIAEDDDSGTDLNFLIQRNLSPGTYYVEVRHWSPSGTGPYQFGIRARGQTTGTGVTATFLFDNALIFSVNIEVNGQIVGSAPAQQTTSYTYSGPPNASVRYILNRPTTPNGQPVGEQMVGTYSITAANGGSYRFNINWQLGNQNFFAPLIRNNFNFAVQPRVNAGLQSQLDCPCTIPASGQYTAFGYYRLFSNSNVEALRPNSTQSWRWNNIANSVQPGSGRIQLNLQ